jgi:hypothetical protein
MPFPQFEVPHCDRQYCKGRCVPPFLAAIIVTIVASVILAKPTLETTGIKLDAAVSTPFTFTFDTLIYVAGWLIAIMLGSTRKHENTIWCFVDAIGIPVAVAALVGLKGLGH